MTNQLGTLILTFHSVWRTSSGQADGPHLDDCVERDETGLPFLPGKTLKGLFRDAAAQLLAFGRAQPADFQAAFGRHVDQVPKASDLSARFLTEKGRIRFGSAQMPESWRNWARANGDQAILDALFDTRATTAIDEETRAARTGTLRRQEVIVPMTLSAAIHSGEPGDKALLENCFPLIRILGASRNRGFGRVSFAWGAGA